MPGAVKKREAQARESVRPQRTDNTASRLDAPEIARMDGPTGSSADDDDRGRRMSNAPGSRAGSAVRAGSAARPMLFDPARKPPLNKNIDYPANVYNMFSQHLGKPLNGVLKE
ncbi:hypothetical protein MMC26_005122 [Xylographa opegraphella]|nr:hypothetical protein [Xylographa opegraphella]